MTTLSASLGGMVTVATFTSGTGTWTVPSSGWYRFVLQGAGGGGGRSPAAASSLGGGGGGSGAAVDATLYLVAGAALSYVVGAAGTGATLNDRAGVSGGDTIIGPLLAAGGYGGPGLGDYSQGNGGGRTIEGAPWFVVGGSSGGQQFTGAGGYAGGSPCATGKWFGSPPNALLGGPGVANGGSGGDSTFEHRGGGGGAGSLFGVGGNGGDAGGTTGDPGTDATGYGAGGGGGGGGSVTTGNGGAGSGGAIFIARIGS